MNTESSDTPDRAAAPKRQLSLFDSTSIIVGIIIGAGIYESVPRIASNVPDPFSLIGVWLLGGVLSLLGALCYVELANMFPEEGGDYVYLTRAFGRRLGFLFAWCQLWVVRPGSIGGMAFIFARYANHLFPLNAWMPAWGSIEPGQFALVAYAVGGVAVLSAINLLGVQQGKWTQNVLTLAKVLGLIVVFAVGLLFSSPAPATVGAGTVHGPGDFALAMIFVLFAYGGWADMAYVGAEIRNPKQNIYRALVVGTSSVAVLYILVTLAFLHALGFQGVRASSALAANVAELGLGTGGDRFVSALICVSTLGAINGLVFTGARIYFAMGRDHRLFAWLGQWHPRQGTPVRSLVVQAAVTVVLIGGFGLIKVQDPTNPAQTMSGFDSMVIFTTPVYWGFLLLVSLTVYQFRDTVPNAARPYRLPWYPFTPFIFGVSSLWMCYRAVQWAYFNRGYAAFWAIGLMAAGVVVCLYDPRRKDD